MELHKDVSDEALKSIARKFIGKIYQKPPLRSSVKKSLRIKKIFELEILERNGKWVLMRILCEAGTYARKLCHDMGILLGVGAHMRELRRTRVGPFREDETLKTMHEISEAYYRWKSEGKEDMLRMCILPVEYAVAALPKVIIKDSAIDAIAHGANLGVPGIVAVSENIKKGDLVAIMSLKGELVALGIANYTTQQILMYDKGLAVKIKRVIMPPGVYPKSWGKSGG